MARHVEMRVLELSTKSKGKDVVNNYTMYCLYIEYYFLMLWAAEEVNVHKEGKLKTRDQDFLIVSHIASCHFSKIYYEGTIIGVDKKT